jgi:environmental stress-induced protein Ves
MQQLLRPSDYQRKPWKNGGGELLDICAEPPGAGLDAFEWRASIALVRASGPFSHFPGVDRTIVLLDGAGMRLDSADWHADMDVAYEPVRFRGEMAVACTLTDGPTRDFNLMVRRGVARGELVVVRTDAVTLPPADAVLCYVAAGAVECAVGAVPAQRVEADCTWRSLRDAGSAPQGTQVRPLSADAVALVATITRSAS